MGQTYRMSTKLHWLARLAFLLLAGSMVACGGSSSITPPPPAGGFSNASLSGQYAFSMSGLDLNGGYIARVGSFVADGNGSITAGLEDVLAGNSPAQQVIFSGGSYTIQTNGTGSLAVQSSTGAGLQFSIILISTGQGALIQTDLNGASSGSFSLQTPASFSASSLSGNFILDFSGTTFSGPSPAPFSIVGQVALDGNGTVTGGTLDENNGIASGAVKAQAGTYQLDSTASGTTFGRGTVTFDGRSFAFYIVNSSRIKIIEEDTFAATMGDALLQDASVPTQNSTVNGSFVYLVTGASILGNQGVDARVARFTADGKGGINAISYDENDNGSANHISQGSNISKSTYAIDTTNTGSGRGTFTFTDSHGGTYTYVFYLISATQGVLQDTSPGIVADGPLLAQTGGSFANPGIAGNYAFIWSGIYLGTQDAIPFEEDYVGQYILSSATSANITGTTDYTQLGLSGNNLFTNIGIAGGLTINTNGTTNNAFKIANGGSPSTTYNFAYYVVSPTTAFMVCTDSTRTTAGVATQQSQ